MKKAITNIFLFLTSLIVGCTNDVTDSSQSAGNKDDLSAGVNISLTAKGRSTRAHWNDGGNGTASFVWDASSDVVTAVKHGSDFVTFTDGKYYSMTQVAPNNDDVTKAELTTTQGLLLTQVGTLPVEAKDPVYCFSPVNGTNGASVTAGQSAISITAPMPNTFSLSATDKLSELKDYSYIYTSTIIQSASTSSVEAQGSTFDTGIVVLRFTLTNQLNESMTVKSITVTADNGLKIFPNKAIWTPGETVPFKVSDETSDYYNTVSVSINGTTGETLASTVTNKYYMYMLPSAGSLEDRYLTFTVNTSAAEYKYTLSAEKLTDSKLKAGGIYTFNFSLTSDITLNTITISQWGQNIFDVNTETLSQTINPNVTPWAEKLLPASSMEFVDLGLTKTIGEKTYKVLWAKTNLGAEREYEKGHYFSWGETSVKNTYTSANYTASSISADITNTANDAVTSAYGLSGYNWMTPTKEDFNQLITQCHSEFKQTMVYGDQTEHYLWFFYKKNADEGHVYTNDPYVCLPATSLWNETETTDDCCHYWTSSYSSSSEAYSFITSYTGSAEESRVATLPAACSTSLRYQGMAIRPIYLKPSN